MSAHAPGPWTLSGVRFKMNGHDFHHVNSEAVKGSEVSVCPVYYDPKHHGRDLANAKLIAAAPEMKEALVDADGCFEAALCEGWLEALADGDIGRIRDLWERRLSHARNLLPAAIAKATGAA